MVKSKKDITKLLKRKNQGIKLDIGCGDNKQEGFIGLDIRATSKTDIVHDAERIPYPLPKESCSVILASHLVEHICPKVFINVMDEWWRLIQVGGQLWISAPYGKSFGFQQDPTHCNALNEATWTYFQPGQPLYLVYKPKPWKIIKNAWFETGNMEIVLEKMSLEEGKKCLK